MELFSSFNDIAAKAGAIGAWKNYTAPQGLQLPFGYYTRYLNLPDARWTKGVYDAIVTQIYTQNPIVYGCIDRITTALGNIKIKVFQRRGEEREEARAGELYDLLQMPTPRHSWGEWLTEWATYYVLSGNGFTRIIDVGGRPRELWNYRPDKVKVGRNTLGQIAGYQYEPGGGVRPEVLELTEVMHIRETNPDGSDYGLSPLIPASRSADSHLAATEHNAKLLQNSANPGGIVNYEKSSLTQDQFDTIEERFQRKFSGPENAGKILVTGGGKITFTSLATSLKDLDWLRGKDVSATEICSTLGVPPELLHREPKYSNKREARRELYIETALPLGRKLISGLRRAVLPRFGSEWEIEADTSEIEELREDQTQLYERNTKAVLAGWLTPNEARRNAGLDELDTPSANELYMPASMEQLSMIAVDVQPQTEE